MLKLLPILLMIGYGLVIWLTSAWRLRAELDARSTPLDHPGLRPVLADLARALGVERLPVHVYEVAPVNGLAAPDGRVFLTRGFLDHFDMGRVTAPELASVIAHELGHVSLGHARRRMIDFTGQNAIRILLGGLLGRILPGVGVWIANLAASAVAARLSRDDEYAADRFASALMIRAGLGTQPQKALFGKLAALTGGGVGAGPVWLASHPPHPRRIAAIEANEARWAATPAAPR
ncbi:M48 family metallopeptidase [Paracoccus sp. p4-l81]|uniref:M48 family metallopeptidase n=1 Tax=Paracoccus sp. p4-l81 TaxID=3342806 RepID=UPI0035B8EA98